MRKSDLPPLDREKVGQFLRDEKRRVGMRDGVWMPNSKLSKQAQGQLFVIETMIGEIVSGKWDAPKENLSAVSTEDLVAELAGREGAEKYELESNEQFVAEFFDDDGRPSLTLTKSRVEGPATILVVEP